MHPFSEKGPSQGEKAAAWLRSHLSITNARSLGAVTFLFAVGLSCYPKPHPGTTGGETSGSGTVTSMQDTGASGDPGTTTSDTGTTDLTLTGSSTTADDTTGKPHGCDDGEPEEGVYCFHERTFPDVFCEKKVAADFNGDGHLDLAVKFDGTIQVLLGDGSGDLTPSTEHSLGELVLSDVVFSAFDMDGDKDADLQVITDTKLFDLRNEGGLFTAPVVHEFPLIMSPVTLVDVSADGLPDVVGVTFSESGPQLRVYLSDGVVFSATEFSLALPGCYGSALGAGQFDADPLLDVLVTSSCNTPLDKSPLVSLHNVGDGSLEKVGMFEVGRDPIAIALSDIDGDSTVDALIGNQASGDISILRGLGDGDFAPEIRIGSLCEECTILRSFATADLDGTGLVDEIVATAFVGKSTLRMVAIFDPLSPQPTISVIHESVRSVIEIGDWNEDGVSDIAFSNEDMSLGILESTP